ncbi:MAG: phosphatidate cytidylyltransferase [Bryobacteraceae bacterium]
MKRLATALVLIPLVSWIILAAPQWLFMAAVAVVGLLAFREYDRIVAEQNLPSPGIVGMAAGLAVLFVPNPWLTAVLVTLVALTAALRVRELSRALSTAAAFVLGVLYIFGAWRCALDLRAMNPHWLMFAMLLSWAGDTAAFYAGHAFGKHALAPRISPAKTWEGSAGSVVGGLVAGAVYGHYLLPIAPMLLVVAIAAAGNVAGQIGDLAESALKRGAGVKDSGTSLPGHGGWLDRIDSSLFAVPVVYALVRWMA